MRDKRSDNTPFIQATVVFLLLFGLVVVASITYDFSELRNLHSLVLLLAILCSALLAKTTYDEARLSVYEGMQHGNDQIFDLTNSIYTELFKNSPVPYLIIDQTGKVQSANTAALRLFAMTRQNLLGINVFQKLQSPKDDHIDLLIEKYRNGIATSDELLYITRPDGQAAWVLLSLFRYVNPQHGTTGLLTLVDITKQKRAEDAKSEFVSLASHQLRTPIAGMKWSAELLQMDTSNGELSTQQKKYIDRLLTSIDRMAVLVDDFLRVSRFELGTFRPELGSVIVKDICQEIIADTAAKVAQKSITVHTEYDETMPTIVSDQNLLRMIITNLYTNAVKYTPVGGEVTLRLQRHDQAFMITVIDTGMGIPSVDQGQIFTKLFRATNASRNVPDGTGLGLYIAKEAVRVLGGKIDFTSSEGIGTTFQVLLPLETAAEPSEV